MNIAYQKKYFINMELYLETLNYFSRWTTDHLAYSVYACAIDFFSICITIR